jgi:predicted protein tyrosine phosphatase
MEPTRPLWERTTISGIRALDDPAGHTHIVSMLDPDWPEPTQFDAWSPETRAMFRFHDEIAPRDERILPSEELVKGLLSFGERLAGDDARLFIHCQSGMSRSTAGAIILWAQAHRDVPAARLFDALDDVREGSWPNTLMLSIADALLDREGQSLRDAALDFFRRRIAGDADGALAARMLKLRRSADLEAIGAMPAQ